MNAPFRLNGNKYFGFGAWIKWLYRYLSWGSYIFSNDMIAYCRKWPGDSDFGT